MAEIQHSFRFRSFSKTQHITHIAFAVCGAPILRYHDRSFVGLQHMETVQLFMEVIIKDSQIPVCTLHHPVRHHLPGDMDVIPQEFLADSV